jgi:N-acetylmuramoyl-L-alanine amidase
MGRLVLVAGIALLLAGCQSPQRVVDNLPPPVVYTPPRPAPRHIEPSPPPPPPPPGVARPRNLGGARIVIDAGHGGKDPGTKALSPLPEKTIVLAISNEVAQLLRGQGAQIISTRTGDQFIELEERARIAERAQAVLFVSIHADAAPRNPAASGSTLYISRNASAASQRAARTIQAALVRAGIECRGIRTQNFKVLVGHSRPAVLIECGFLTNSGDATRLNTPAYRSRMAAAIAAGIGDYITSR